MSLSISALTSLLPRCGLCREVFSDYLHSPRILGCGHSVCLSCLERRPKQKCPFCSKKFKKHHPNGSLAELISQMGKLKMHVEKNSSRCDECGVKSNFSDLCRCTTCEDNLNGLPDLTSMVSSLLCMKCCVLKHNGHNVVRLPKSFRGGKDIGRAVAPVAAHVREVCGENVQEKKSWWTGRLMSVTKKFENLLQTE